MFINTNQNYRTFFPARALFKRSLLSLQEARHWGAFSQKVAFKALILCKFGLKKRINYEEYWTTYSIPEINFMKSI
jgi:hypothetical protein